MIEAWPGTATTLQLRMFVLAKYPEILLDPLCNLILAASRPYLSFCLHMAWSPGPLKPSEYSVERERERDLDLDLGIDKNINTLQIWG